MPVTPSVVTPSPNLPLHYEHDVSPPTGKDCTNLAGKPQKAVEKACTYLDKAKRRDKSDFDKPIRKSHDRPTVGGWILFDPSEAIYKPLGDDKSKLTHVTEGPYKFFHLSFRITVIQRGPFVERVTVDRITPALATVFVPESYQYASTHADIAAKNIDCQAFLVDGLLNHRRKKNGTLEVFVQWAGDFETIWEPLANIWE